jgi:hypothetical protein
MQILWGACWQKSQKRLKAGWLTTAGPIAIYLGAIQPMESFRGIASERATGRVAADGQPISLWRSMRPSSFFLRETERCRRRGAWWRSFG